MRRSEFEISGKNAICEILDKIQTLRIGLIVDGMPYIVPFVYGYKWCEEYPVFFIHCGMAGKKSQGIYDGAKVSYELDIDGPIITTATHFANNFSREFCCIMGEGELRFARNEEEKKEFFSQIMLKQVGNDNYDYQSGWLSMTNVIMIIPYKMSASQKGMRNNVKIEKPEGFSWEQESKDSEGAVFWD